MTKVYGQITRYRMDVRQVGNEKLYLHVTLIGVYRLIICTSIQVMYKWYVHMHAALTITLSIMSQSKGLLLIDKTLVPIDDYL